MNADDPLIQAGQDRYMASARVALRAWRQIRVAWLEALSSHPLPLTCQEAEKAREELARCDVQIARLEHLLKDQDAADDHGGAAGTLGEQARER
jgi:hypothetical protein